MLAVLLTYYEKTNETRIRCAKKFLPRYESMILSYIAIYGRRKEKESSRYVYFTVKENLLFKKWTA